MSDAAAAGETGPYDVVLLCEQALSPDDARQVTTLHRELEGPVTYHVLLPVEDAAARVEAAMGSLAAGEVMASPAMVMNEVDLDQVRQDCLERSKEELRTTLARLREAGAHAEGRVVHEHPVDALSAAVTETGCREAIILTRPHVVAEFFHLDWTSRARRRIGVPCLHLLEHEAPEERAGGGEGVTGS
jgi:hypothetical protein